MRFYDKRILPRVLNWTCGSEPIQQQRKKIVPLAEGRVLEIGIGSGLNLPFYDAGKIEHIIGLDPPKKCFATPGGGLRTYRSLSSTSPWTVSKSHWIVKAWIPRS